MPSPKMKERIENQPKQKMLVLKPDLPVGEVFRNGNKLYVKTNTGSIRRVDKLTDYQKFELQKTIELRERLKNI